jgi:SAM-dependent methyltransferase
MNEDLKRWDESAKEWVNHKDSKHKFKPYLVKSAIAKLMPELRDKIVFDAGCGDGYYAKHLMDLEAKVYASDGSQAMIGIAGQNNPGPDYSVLDLTGKWPFDDSYLDHVFSCMVLMSLASLENFLLESKRTLKSSGSLIFCVSHPAFSEPVMSLYKSLWDKLTFKRPRGLVSNYFQKPLDNRPWSRGPKNRAFYPRTLQSYSQELGKHGFVIAEICEPHEFPEEFLKSYPQYEYATRLPRFLFIKAVQR